MDSLDNYPNIKKHLDQFQSIITSSNKPYGLHRARNEKFFKGEKIIAKRKSVDRPNFSYNNIDSYVSQTFNVIKTERFNNKYLVALLNSNLIKFWLKHRGKLQGKNYQLDTTPILNIPIKKSNYENEITILVNKIIIKISIDKNNDIYELEKKINTFVYETYGLSKKEIAIIEKDVKI